MKITINEKEIEVKPTYVIFKKHMPDGVYGGHFQIRTKKALNPYELKKIAEEIESRILID